MINLISDTVTKPTKAMLRAMFEAQVGDDVFGEDPSVNALEAKMTSMFGKDAAVFCPSGTMTNQIAIKTHTQPLDELICDVSSHVYQYEAGGYAFNSGISINLIEGQNGKINSAQIKDAVKPDYDWLPKSKLVVLENSCNKGGGSYYTLEEITTIRKTCNELNLKLHLDGARLFNVLVETNEACKDIGDQFDSISICLSKGLGAPVGSVLIGDKAFIKQARRYRKVMGGGMRQAGYLAAAGSYALEHNIERLKVDNQNAKILGDHLEKMSYVKKVLPVFTNIVIFEIEEESATFIPKLAEKGIGAVAFGKYKVRFVCHMEITDEMIQKTMEVLTSLQ
jgi:threonine aldolase